MGLADRYKEDDFLFSAEVFAPFNNYSFDKFYSSVGSLKDLGLHFISITSHYSMKRRSATPVIAAKIRTEFGIDTLVHLTCRGKSPYDLEAELILNREIGNTNLMALLGDPLPKQYTLTDSSYSYALDLVKQIKSMNEGRYLPKSPTVFNPVSGIKTNFSIAVAGYPEKHPLAKTLRQDVKNLKKKIDAGASLILTQMIFDVKAYETFVLLAREEGINVPIVPGIMPITSVNWLDRITNDPLFANITLPVKIRKQLESAPNKINGGLEITIQLIQELYNCGAPGVHLYTLNKSDLTREIVQGIST